MDKMNGIFYFQDPAVGSIKIAIQNMFMFRGW